ncbi:MAG TPA: hypothetical protein VGX48_27385 [Pyrinomonadaceae bacterium]|jgi:hypothetical protein|nr:hypothetical protein [Pyrinomonadaceae bacterium]
MAFLRWALIAVGLLLVGGFVYLWFTRPVKVDMAAYAPTDSIVYMETDDLPAVVEAVVSTDAWRELAPAAGVGGGWYLSPRTSRWLSFTGLGPGEAVVLSRAQVAVTILGFEAAEESGTAIKFTPRAALVAETHTSEWRVRSAVEKIVGDFARKSFGAPSVERKEVDGVGYVTWAAQGGSRKRIVAAVYESVAVVGNDESAVRACVDVRRGGRKSLAGNAELEDVRARVGARGALAFGFAPTGSAARMVEVFAPALVGGVSEDSKAQSLMATVLPQLINQTLGSVGWSSHLTGGRVEDRYFLGLAGGVAQRLGPALSPPSKRESGAAGLLPAGTYQVSLYDFRSPEEAWKAVGAALSSQVDISRATIITLALESLLKPYGVERPRDFLRAGGPWLATARLDAKSEGKVLLTPVRNETLLRELVRTHLGAGASKETIDGAELFVSTAEDRGAAGFVNKHLLLGSEEDVRRCLKAISEKKTLGADESFKTAPLDFSAPDAFVRTITDDRESARAVVGYFAARRGEDSRPADPQAFERALTRHAYSESETRVTDVGFEKRTLSAFGQFGEMVVRFAPR